MAVNLAGLREDGRRTGELRQVSVKLGHDGSYDGSAHFQIGQTRILAEVFGPHELQSRRQEGQDRAVIKVEFSPVPFSESDSKRKRVGPNKQSSELVLAVQKALEASIVVTNYPNTQIDVCLTVLQDDGAKLTACINAASLAVIDAGIAMTDLLVACTVGVLKGLEFFFHHYYSLIFWF
jgi:exosome complex component RRP41